MELRGELCSECASGLAYETAWSSFRIVQGKGLFKRVMEWL